MNAVIVTVGSTGGFVVSGNPPRQVRGSGPRPAEGIE